MEHAEQRPREYIPYIAVAVLILSLIWPRLNGSKPETLSETLTACVAFMTFLIKVIPGEKLRGHAAAPAQPFRLGPSFMSGWYGGIVGGAVAGLIIGPSYYFSLGSGYNEDWKE
jgi:hypothetical protein